MLNQNVLQLNPVSALTGQEQFYVVQSATDYRASPMQVAAYTTQTYLGFTSLGVGAVPRTIQSRLGDIISVKDFGALGDGVTDATMAIQAAINMARTLGGSVWFPPGTYLISNTLTVYSDVALIGATRYGVNILQQSTTYLHLYGVDVNRVSLKNITLTGQGINSAGGGGIYFTRANDSNTEGLYFENLTVQNCANTAIALSTPILSTFINVKALNIAGHGFDIYGGS